MICRYVHMLSLEKIAGFNTRLCTRRVHRSAREKKMGNLITLLFKALVALYRWLEEI